MPRHAELDIGNEPVAGRACPAHAPVGQRTRAAVLHADIQTAVDGRRNPISAARHAHTAGLQLFSQ
jgi:hypothetical protein